MAKMTTEALAVKGAQARLTELEEEKTGLLAFLASHGKGKRPWVYTEARRGNVQKMHEALRRKREREKMGLAARIEEVMAAPVAVEMEPF